MGNGNGVNEKLQLSFPSCLALIYAQNICEVYISQCLVHLKRKQKGQNLLLKLMISYTIHIIQYDTHLTSDVS